MPDLLRESTPQTPPPIDSFLSKPSKLEGFYLLILLSSGGIILGHTIATLPAFRGVAIAIALTISLTLAAWIGYPRIQERVGQNQHLGTGSKGKLGLINQSIALAMFAPGLALAGLMLLGILLAWI